MSEICDFDCFNCKYDDCINDEPEDIERMRDYQRKWHQKKRDEAVAAGMCTICYKRPATDGYKICPECRRKSKEAQARRRERRKEVNQ